MIALLVINNIPENIAGTVTLCHQPKTVLVGRRKHQHAHETQIIKLKSNRFLEAHIWIQMCMCKCQFLMNMVSSFPRSIKVHLNLTSKTLNYSVFSTQKL